MSTSQAENHDQAVRDAATTIADALREVAGAVRESGRAQAETLAKARAEAERLRAANADLQENLRAAEHRLRIATPAPAERPEAEAVGSGRSEGESGLPGPVRDALDRGMAGRRGGWAPPLPPTTREGKCLTCGHGNGEGHMVGGKYPPLPHEVVVESGPKPDPECPCAACDPGTSLGGMRFASRMSVCPECGDKRCPRATWHGKGCQKNDTKEAS